MLVGSPNRLSATIVGLILGVLFVLASAGPAAAQVQPISADTSDVLDFTYDAPGDVARALAGEPASFETTAGRWASTVTPVGGTSAYINDLFRLLVAPSSAVPTNLIAEYI